MSDAWGAYNSLTEKGYRHVPVPALMPGVRMIAYGAIHAALRAGAALLFQPLRP